SKTSLGGSSNQLFLRRAVACVFEQLWVVEIEGRTLRANPRQRGEVVARRRARGRPFQRCSVAPRVIDGDLRRVAGGDPHVPEERNHGQTQQQGADRRHLVHPGEAVLRQVVGIATG